MGRSLSLTAREEQVARAALDWSGRSPGEPFTPADLGTFLHATLLGQIIPRLCSHGLLAVAEPPEWRRPGRYRATPLLAAALAAGRLKP